MRRCRAQAMTNFPTTRQTQSLIPALERIYKYKITTTKLAIPNSTTCCEWLLHYNFTGSECTSKLLRCSFTGSEYNSRLLYILRPPEMNNMTLIQLNFIFV
jgi:hypothetical protein